MKQGDILTNKSGNKVKVLEAGKYIIHISMVDNFERAALGHYTEMQITEMGYQLPKEEWMPVNGERYFYISTSGQINAYRWVNDDFDINIKSFIGIFKTREEAQKRLEEIKNLLK